tara:strand:+ start:167 stop:484 length:318 start_codon:yes stop_codon:yes gene_type:complete
MTEVTEVLGGTAILCAAVGGLFQLERTSSTANVESFAPVYIGMMIIAESLFAIQGFLKGSLTITLAKTVGALYFLYLISFKFFPRKKEKEAKIEPETEVDAFTNY